MQRVGTLSRRTLLAALPVLAATPAAARDGLPDFLELPAEGMEQLNRLMWIKLLAPGVWVTCFAWDDRDLGMVPANGMIVSSDAGAIIVDTGNNPEQGAQLLATAQRVTGKAVTQAIATHYHGDRTGGLEAMRAANVPVLAHPYSVGLAQAYGEPVPTPVRGLEKEPVALGPLELFYPGGGHTRDNIVVWHAESRVLFGGCLLRSTTDRGIGSRGDADMAAFPASLARLAERYPNRRIVIPGHGSIAGDAVTWSQGLVDAAIARAAAQAR